MSVKGTPQMYVVIHYLPKWADILIMQEDAEENPYHKLHLEGHEHGVRALAARGRTLVSGSYDCTVRIWDIIDGKMKWVLHGHTQKGSCSIIISVL